MPASRSIDIYQGDDYIHDIYFEDPEPPHARLDKTGATYAAKLAATRGGATVATFSISTAEANVGHIVVSLADATTAGITPGSYYWDFEEIAAGIKTTVMDGVARVKGQVTS